MAITYTTRAKLRKPAFADTGWDVPINANSDQLDAVNAVGGLAVVTHERPSTTLLVDVAAGSYAAQDGTIGTYAGSTSNAIATGTTKSLYLDLTAAGALVIGSAFPTTAHVRLATVVAGATTITSITDARVAYAVCGAFADGVNIALGTATGTKIGTGPTEKIGFYGATPIVRPTVAAATIGATSTATEQAALQSVLNAIRALGLGG